MGAEEAAYARVRGAGDDRAHCQKDHRACEGHCEVGRRNHSWSQAIARTAGTGTWLSQVVSEFERVESASGSGVPAKPWRHTVACHPRMAESSSEGEFRPGIMGRRPPVKY